MKRIAACLWNAPGGRQNGAGREANAGHFGGEVKVCVTAQHRQMLDQVLNLFGIMPEYDLNLMQPGQDLNGIPANVLVALRGVLADFSPDVVLVHGDTAPTFAASLGAYYKKIPVTYVAADLRTGNRYFFWSEEIKRRLDAVMAAFQFAPTATLRDNLLRKLIEPECHIRHRKVSARF